MFGIYGGHHTRCGSKTFAVRRVAVRAWFTQRCHRSKHEIGNDGNIQSADVAAPETRKTIPMYTCM